MNKHLKYVMAGLPVFAVMMLMVYLAVVYPWFWFGLMVAVSCWFIGWVLLELVPDWKEAKDRTAFKHDR